MNIDAYTYGSMTIDGKVYKKDFGGVRVTS